MDIARREFLRTTGLAALAAALSSGCSGSLLRNLVTEDKEKPSMDGKETLDRLLEENRKRDLASGFPGSNNHVPMMLIALYRMGAGPERMQRYAATFPPIPQTPAGMPPAGAIPAGAWKETLGRGAFPDYVAFFDEQVKRSSVEAVLRDSVSVLMKGCVGAAYHPLLRLGYAIDCDSREEIVFSLAYWAATYVQGRGYDAAGTPVEPEALFADIVKRTEGLSVRKSNSIVAMVTQVYGAEAFSKALRPVRFPESEPLERISGLILETFTRTQHFTLLHALTACQALRIVLPYASDPRTCVSAFWHSVCAAWLTVSRTGFETGKDSLPAGSPDWKGLFANAVAGEGRNRVADEHVVKLVYSCGLESRHYKRDAYLALAARECVRPSPFV